MTARSRRARDLNLVAGAVVLAVVMALASPAAARSQPDSPAAFGAATAAPADADANAGATPVFSLRRLPKVLANAVADSRLSAELGTALGDPVIGGARDSSCLRVQDRSGRQLYNYNPSLPLIPASTVKLATAAVALARLDPQSRLVTEVRAAAPAADGTVENLWLVGGGDPLLSTAGFASDAGFSGQPRLSTSVETLADRVVAAGVRRVTGTVIGDDSRYDSLRSVPTWDPSYQRSFDVSPLSALVVDKGFTSRSPVPVLARSPAVHAAGVLKDLLAARGVAVDGPAVGEGAAPAASSPVAAVESPPLAEVVGEIVANSDNLGAEMLVKEIGLKTAGSPTTAGGVGIVRQGLATLGVSLEGAVIVDGSGLDRSDRLTCSSLHDLIDRHGEESDLYRALPVAGVSGTLINRFARTPAQGRVRAKTGGLNGVVSLAGWVTGGSAGSVRFAMIANNLPRGSAGAALADKVVSALARYPDAPGPAELGPAVFAPGRPRG